MRIDAAADGERNATRLHLDNSAILLEGPRRNSALDERHSGFRRRTEVRSLVPMSK